MRRYRIVLLLLGLALLAGWNVLHAQIDDLRVFVVDTRNNLDLLADATLGEDERPEGWTANRDVISPQVISDLWYDTELLATALLGQGNRPEGWIGATSPRPEVLTRNVRHDLELLAESQLGDERPADWTPPPPLITCSRALQNLAATAQNYFGVVLQTPETVPDYCQAVEFEIEDQLEQRNLLTTLTPEEITAETLAVRGDLERLADENLGVNVRPPGWFGNRDPESPTLVGDTYLDLETLATPQLGENRPDGWIGTVGGSAFISYRNLRHDLELLADATRGLDQRPRGWQGENPLRRCNPIVQNLVVLAEQSLAFTTQAVSGGSFCDQVAGQVNLLAENPPVEEVDDTGLVSEVDRRFLAESQIAFTYLDVAATQYMGIMPAGVEFRAWYRNFNLSQMMFVSGEDFAVYVDRRWTTLTEDVFDSLPTLEGVAPLTFCDAYWCNGPGPTPTPTGSGPLELLLSEATPPAPPSQEEIADKTQVTYANIRVTYLQDNLEANTAQVALEICTDPTLIDCEPVTSVFNNNTGAPQPVLSQFNGLNVYEFPFGYNDNLVIEGSTLVSSDMWISDPSLEGRGG